MQIFRWKDILLASLVILFLSPLFLFICLLLFLTQEKIFFTQLRPGKDEQPFRLVKFSTLRDISAGEEEGVKDRMRETSVGGILRKTSLDELPQLFNIIKGDMTFVGPRPLLIDYLPLYTEEERIRHKVKPGLTGWAQIHGRNRLSFKERFVYDIWYVKNKSVWLDLYIVLHTIPSLFNSKNVYASLHHTSAKFNGLN